jgi:signal transduction histidine kinase
MRVLTGALLWTLGLFIIISTVFTRLILTSPHTGAIFHHLFSQVAIMSVVALSLLAAGFVQVRSGLTGLSRLREKLADVHAGRESAIDGEYPSEVQPLVDDLNALLDTHDRNVTRAQAKAGDLAHGLKTPLAILAQEADRARAAGHADLADAVAGEVVRMRRQIDYHLAHARAAASAAAPTARVSIAEAVEGLQRTVSRLYAERGLSITAAIATEHAFRGQRADLDEMLGNLLDNACKWAHRLVHVASAVDAGRVTITIDDDGPGLPAEMRAAVLRRGVRADETAPGDGLGLAIVRDLATVYGGEVSLAASPLGGLRAVLTLPVA